MSGLHRWDVSPAEAAKVQHELRRRLDLVWRNPPVSSVGGVDVHFRRGRALAAFIVLDYPNLTPLEAATAELPVAFPYIPGLLAFREGPVVLQAWERLRRKPDLIMFDAQGIAHPRGFGLASHMALWLERPGIGVAKSRLYGRHAMPGPRPGDRAPLVDEKDPSRVIGAVVRTQAGGPPIYLSPGDRIDVEHAVEFALACCRESRIPEPTRWAHEVAQGKPFPTEPAQLGLL